MGKNHEQATGKSGHPKTNNYLKKFVKLLVIREIEN